jgi:hypothetical protein
MKRKPSALVVVALMTIAGFPAAAHASFAPRVSVNIDPATPHARPAVETTLTETAGDTPPKRFTLSFPRGFALKHPSGVKTCAAAKRRSGRCSRASEIGSVAAVLPTGAHLRGTVNLARRGKSREIAVLLHGAAGMPQMSFVGYSKVAPTGASQLTLDELPNVPLSSLTVRLTGGTRGMVTTPRACGSSMVQGLLTSQLGELAVGLSPVQIAGC